MKTGEGMKKIILLRKINDSIRLGGPIAADISILDISPNKVMIGIKCKNDISVKALTGKQNEK